MNFAGIEDRFCTYEGAEILLQPIIYDGTSTWGKGADKGFAAFAEAAENMELYDIETDSEVYRRGIHTLPSLTGYHSPDEMFEAVYSKSQELIKSKKFITYFGGEHSVSIGAMKAYYEEYPDISILQIDAHADLRPEYNGSAYNHACALHDVSQNTHLVQVGIRSMDKSEFEYLDEDNCFFAHELDADGAWMDEAVSLLKDTVYITFDLDAFDPSILPATGTPEPGGLAWFETLEFLKRVFMRRNVVGFDIVELAPIEGHRASEFLAAKLYYKMLSYKFEL